jgi:hypothetical protein
LLFVFIKIREIIHAHKTLWAHHDRESPSSSLMWLLSRIIFPLWHNLGLLGPKFTLIMSQRKYNTAQKPH